jgi:hypothetical protein
LGIPLDTQETLLKYIGGFHSYLGHTILMFNSTSLDEVCVQVAHLKFRGENVNVDFVKPFKPTEGKKKGKGKENFKLRKYNTVKKEKATCTHCKKEGHNEDLCWILHPELKPSKFGNKGNPKTTTTTQTNLGSNSGDGTKITVMGIKIKNYEASTSSSVQSIKVDNEVDEIKRTKIFHIRVISKHTKIDTLFDSGSQVELISETIVKKFVLITKPLKKKYPLGWIHNDNQLQMNRQCCLKFDITSQFIDEVDLDVEPYMWYCTWESISV